MTENNPSSVCRIGNCGLTFTHGHSLLYKFLHKFCKTRHRGVVIAGSSALNKKIVSTGGRGITPNDVDFFTSLTIGDTASIEFLVQDFNDSNDKYTLSFNTGPVYTRTSSTAGVFAVWNFQLFDNKYPTRNKAITPNPQLICILGTSFGGVDDVIFADEIMNRFDISICKCAIIDPCNLGNVYTRFETDIRTFKMRYDLNKFRSVSETISRIQKYQDRGYTLDRITLGRDSVIKIQNGNMRLLMEQLDTNRRCVTLIMTDE